MPTNRSHAIGVDPAERRVRAAGLRPDTAAARVAQRTRRPTGRRAVTLLELLAVIAILGIFVAVAVSRIGPATLRDFGARVDANRLAFELLQARRRSIATGENHYLAFAGAGGQVTGYTLYRRSGAGGDIAADSPHDFPGDVVVSASHSEAEFTFEGTALASYQFTLVGPVQTWRVDVIPVTGAVKVAQIAP